MGDTMAYRNALASIAQRLRRFYGRRLQALPDEVEDLVQETLLALHLQRGTYDPSLPVSAWAVAIARHKLVDAWRRRGRRDAWHDAIEDVDEALLACEPDDGGARRDLAVLLDDLPEAQRQAIVLTKLEGLSVAEAAASTGASESAIKVQVHRGLKRLAELVREHFDLRPKGIIQMLDLLRPIYTKTAAYGHFGREEPEFTWERTDKAAALRAAAGL